MMSGKTRLFYAIIFIILLIVSIKAGFAVQEDFNAYAQTKMLYVCACSDVENTITVENTGDTASIYNIAQEGGAVPYSALNPSSFTLQPGESKDVHNFITAPCGEEGKYDLTTKIDTAFETSKEISQNVDIRECVNIDVVQTKQPDDICPCESVRYDFLVKNTGDFVETYWLNATPFAEYISISEDFLVLSPGQSQEVYVFVTTPCGFFGEYDFNFMVSAQRSGIIAELPFKLRVNPCYDYTIASADSYSICKDIRNTAPVTITNNADVANTYYLSTNAEWTFFDTIVSLGKKQQTGINLTLYPASVPEGIYNVTLGAVSERGQLAVEKSVSVSVENCYSVMLSADVVPQLVSCEKYTTNVHATNDGTRQSIYGTALFGSSWASMGSSTVSVNAGETKDIPITLDVPCNETGEFDFTLTTNVTNFPEKVAQSSFIVDVVSIQDAYSVQIDSIDDKIETNYEGNIVPLTITSLGIRESKYKLDINTTENWINLENKEVTVPAGQAVTVNLLLSPTNETPRGNYDISVIAVPEGQNVGYERSFSIKLRDKTFMESFLGFWIYVISGIFLLILVILVLILVSRKRKKQEGNEEFWKDIEGEPSRIVTPKEETKETLLEVDKKDRSWLKWILIILAIILLLGAGIAGIFFVVYSGEPANDNNTMQDVGNRTEINQTEAVSPGLFSRWFSSLFGEKNTTEPNTPEPLDTSIIENATIFVNRSGLRGFGDTVEVRGYEQIKIPVTIQNNYEPNTFKIKVNEDVDWIEVDKSVVEIEPNEKQVINIIVTPDENVEEGNYRIDVKIDIDGREVPIQEEIVLKVTQEKPFYLKYLWYILAGLAVLLLIGLITFIRNWNNKRKEEPLKETKKKEKKIKKEKEIIESQEEGGWLKWLVLGIIIMVILAGLIFGAIVAYKGFNTVYSGQNQTVNETYNETPNQAKVEIEEPAKIDYEKVFVKKASETVIPIRISNVNETATFHIKINEDIDWLAVDTDSLEIKPNESAIVNLMASPNQSVDEGNYKVTVNVNVEDDDTQFTQGFILQVREGTFSAIWSYILYALVGLLILVIILAVLRKRENKGYYEDNEDKKSDKESKKKTSIKIK